MSEPQLSMPSGSSHLRRILTCLQWELWPQCRGEMEMEPRLWTQAFAQILRQQPRHRRRQGQQTWIQQQAKPWLRLSRGAVWDE
mmetsp:Transcript_8529/g.21819  ORF Transcript_8529/g.21819 Transcript_8529/m.21819 type:complete len:84 (+) Transcript_8529:277-528(+)